MRRLLKWLALLILLALAILVWRERVHLLAFPGIIGGFTAKEYCSCRYVARMPEDYCRGYAKQWLPATLADDPLARRVSATGLGVTRSAVWLGEREGCRLLTQEDRLASDR